MDEKAKYRTELKASCSVLEYKWKWEKMKNESEKKYDKSFQINYVYTFESK